MGEELRTPAFSRTFGGGTVITALAAARLGARVEVVSALPEEAAVRLSGEGVRVRNLRRSSEPHAVSVALSTRRDRAFVTFDGVNTEIEARLLTQFSLRLPSAGHVHLALGPRRLMDWARILTRLRARGVSTSWDFGWHEDLPRRRGFRTLVRALDWVFVNERESRLYTGMSTLATAAVGWRDIARNVVVKCGAHGAVALVDGEAAVRMAAPPARVVDTTGAGDAFNGGFLAALVRGATVTDCLKAGVTVGTLSTRAAGGLDGLPSWRELKRLGHWRAETGHRRAETADRGCP